MLSDILARLWRVRFTVGYVAALFAMSTAMLIIDQRDHDWLIRHASTNLHNLSHGRLGTLLGSAFVVEAGPLYFWLPFLTCLLVLAELHLRSIRLIVAFMVGHVGATLLVAAALAVSVKMGWMPWSITRVSDVGMSYGALAALGALTATIPRRWRAAWIAWWMSVGLAAAIFELSHGSDMSGVTGDELLLRLESLRGYGKLPRGRERRNQPLTIRRSRMRCRCRPSDWRTCT